MAGLKVSEFNAAAPLDGSELLGAVQGDENVKVTASDFADLVGAVASGLGIVKSIAAMEALSPVVDGDGIYLVAGDRSGLFEFDSSDLSAKVTADTEQGIYIAPDSDPDGSSGAWVRQFDGVSHRPEWFGAVGDDSTNDATAFVAAIAYLKAVAPVTSANGFYKTGPILLLSARSYYFGTTTIDINNTLTIQGQGGFSAGGPATRMRWAAGATGLRFQAYNTSGEATVDGVTHTGSNGSRISDVFLEGDYSATEGDYHAIHSKAVIEVERCTIYNWQGEGIRSRATVGGAASLEGNCSFSCFSRVRFESNRIGLYVSGSDANAIMVDGCEFIHNRQAGYVDDSGIGSNTLIGIHASSNGISASATIPAQTSYSGNRYAVIWGQESGASTNAPSGTTADNTWWYYIEAGGADAPNGIPAWSSGLTWRAGGDYMVVNNTTQVTLETCYSEEGSFSQFGNSVLLLGGVITDRYRQGGRRISVGSSRLLIDGGTTISGGLNATGTDYAFGPDSGTAADSNFTLHNYNVTSTITFQSNNPGAQIDGQIISVRGSGVFYKSRGGDHSFRDYATNTVWADINTNGINLGSGRTLKVNGTQVVGAQGAAVADATAITGGESPTEAEFNAVVTQLNLVLARLRSHGLIAT